MSPWRENFLTSSRESPNSRVLRTADVIEVWRSLWGLMRLRLEAGRAVFALCTIEVDSTFFIPNQLSHLKGRQSLAEHDAVLSALTEIARHEKTAVMALLRRAARQLVRERASAPDTKIRELVLAKASEDAGPF